MSSFESEISLHSIETFGTLDGPGIRTVFFLQGCPLRCGYCHNPDTWALEGGQSYTIEALLKIVKRYKPYYGEEGGVTFSGGEPLLQAQHLSFLIDVLHEEGVHVTLDTSGVVTSPQAKENLLKADLVLLDIKQSDEYAFKELTGGHFESFLRTLQWLKDHQKSYWIRQVIVPGYNDGVEQLNQMLKCVESPMCEKIELLAYHKHGLFKWEALGLKSPFRGYEPMPVDRIKDLQEWINSKRILL